ncbi:MAG: NADH-quinone oxidoreductase subunit F [Proteobacteria bacterium]|nr:NADH-quinone oxidoreductase subunit F [Pseudomonadota bacterium]
MPEQRIVTRNCGAINPKNIDAYLKSGGFEPFLKARDQMSPEAVVAEIKASGLTGRGGAGFNCGMKWEMAAGASDPERYLICNADEGEVGAFKDKYLITHDPFGLIEGMAIAGYAVGARQAFIYLRNEYHFLYEHLSNALNQAKEKDFLEHMDIRIFEGAGAYICGEETALMNSIEGLRAETRFKPPFPTDKGLWGKPTVINNVETLMNVPVIVQNGGDWYAGIGTETSKGTKLFSVSGDVEKPGVYELVMGSTLRELVEEMAGARDIKAIQVGGASGPLVPYAECDMPLAHESVLGSGSVMVFDNSRDIIDIVYRDLCFLAEESCGQCTPCREGTRVMVEVLERLTKGDGANEDIDILESLGPVLAQSSICGLGQSAPIPVMDSLKHFGQEYRNRIDQAMLLRSLSKI